MKYWMLLVCVGCGSDPFSVNEGALEGGAPEIDEASVRTVSKYDGGAGGATVVSVDAGHSENDAAGDGGSGGDAVDSGIDVVDSGVDDAQGGSGGAPSHGGTGGVVSAGGSGGCELVTHENGLGQTWEDCVPSGTYDHDQSVKACEAWCAQTTCTTNACAASFDCNQLLVGAGDGEVRMTWASTDGRVQQVISGGFCQLVGFWN